MNINICITSTSADATEELGFDLGSRLKGGEIFRLNSDLGGGKTTFTRGLARGAGSKDVVSSPTFTISKVYKAPNFEICHFDFYRINEPGLIVHELTDYINDPNMVLVIEWGQIVDSVLPAKTITIDIVQTSDDGREFNIVCPPEYAYLMEGQK